MGAYNCEIKSGTLTEKVYEDKNFRKASSSLEVNNDFVEKIEEAGRLFRDETQSLDWLK